MNSVQSDEKDALLVNEDQANYDTKPPTDTPPTVYTDAEGIKGYIYNHRTRIPGYGVYRMIRNVRPYALWVLFAMLVVFLLNQLDRYTLPIVTPAVGYDLQYGDKVCMANRHLNDSILKMAGVSENITDLCVFDDETKDLDIK